MKELIVFNQDQIRKIALVEDEELVEIYAEDETNKSIEGNIYVGKVQNVLNGLQSAFVDIGENKAAFIHVKDILPKTDVTKNEKPKDVQISKLIKSGDPIIVEVKREAIDKKGPRLSTHLSLSSRFMVFMPNAPFVTVSQKIENDEEKKRLKEIAQKYLPENTGAIVRTVAENQSEEVLKNDLLSVIKKWEEIQSRAVEKFPQIIYDKGGILKKTVVDLADSKLDRIVVRDEKDKDIITDILNEIGANVKIDIDKDILSKYSLQKQIEATHKNKIWLKSGGFITIDKTEALVAIDVNSGKFTGKDDVEETVTAVNLEAAKEICKQIRLLDISGIIIIDFIDMKEDKNKEAVIEAIKKYSKKDRSRVQVEDYTKLNLMHITRKHINSKKETV